MASFDFIDAANKGYKFAWQERRVLSRLALFPLTVKAVTFMLITALALDKNILRQGLMLLPAYFLEGWLVAQVIRFALLGAQDMDPALEPLRRRAIMASTLIYVLLKLLSALFTGLMMESATPETSAEPVSAGIYATLVMILIFSIWAFRFFWIFIPVAIDYPMRSFLKKIEAFASSFYMMGLWVLCVIPAALVTLGAAQLLMAISPPIAPDTPSVPYTYMLVIVQAVMETVLALVSSIGMAYGIRAMIMGDKPKPLF